ncbi:MAG: hypothetical protein R3F55_03405 [Alphaproteobacteria bacterium]
MSIPRGAIEIGSHFYLFKSSTNKEDCLISAHGGYDRNVTMFEPKGCTLFFYGEHGNVLSDPGLALMALKGLKVVEQIPDAKNKKALNYILSKYQGRHSKANETYEKIIGRIESEDTQIAKLLDRIANAASEFQRSNAQTQLAYYKSMNVLTIRNRWWRSDLSLESAVTAAKKALPSLTRFHCSFCRSFVEDDNPAVSHVQFA